MNSEPLRSGFSSFADFLAMGGHGFYVWLAYGVGLLIFLFLLLEPVVRRRQLRTRLQAFYRREQLDAQSDERGMS
ncbi:heme exporter protein CcmD [Permianibacter sp. IMCC34836]|uniref:heme exporter protein CcmD n=1 Tax=Permianibacter fluminis TaxID=2738515 RepID=UPI001551A5FC|nr:heme exporter protein CcmD [Permianibacter fluminis]NQD38217.1 heme exporter protein CcmD [Permianibacter fluminis]